MPNIWYNSRPNSGFTLVETLVVITAIGILAAVVAPSWLSFVDTRRLGAAQDEIYIAIRKAQSKAKKEKLTWQFSLREQDNIVQWAIHPATPNPANVNWNNLDPNVRLDDETTYIKNGLWQVTFDFRGHVDPPFKRITLSAKNGGKAKRCVIVSTLLGAMRTAKERPKPQDGRYCY